MKALAITRLPEDALKKVHYFWHFLQKITGHQQIIH
jgi:hypothetical protein